MSHSLRFSALSFVIACALFAFSGAAQAQSEVPAPALRLQLESDRAPTPEYAAKVHLAERSLAGPRAEIAAGALVMSGSTFVALIGGLVYAIGEHTPDGGALATVGGGVLGVMVGAVMLGHGVTQIHAIKVARHEVSLRGAQVALREGGGSVSASFAF